MIGADKKKLNILRVMICAVILCAFMWALMYGYAEGIEILAEKLEEINPNKTGDMKNTMWLIEHIMFILPVCILLIFQLVLYLIWKEQDAQVLHRECFISLLVAFLFTYAILLPAVIIFSKQAPAQIDEETGKEVYHFILVKRHRADIFLPLLIIVVELTAVASARFYLVGLLYICHIRLISTCPTRRHEATAHRE